MRHLLVAMILLQMQCKKKEPDPVPNAAPNPLIHGKCHNVVQEYHGNGFWSGVSVCEFEGSYWQCPTGNPESARICRRGEPLPAEQPK